MVRLEEGLLSEPEFLVVVERAKERLREEGLKEDERAEERLGEEG
jgi:hypothetical protein